MLVERVAKSPCRRMEGNVTCILPVYLYTLFVLLKQMLGVVLQKPITIRPPNFYPLGLNVVV